MASDIEGHTRQMSVTGLIVRKNKSHSLTLSNIRWTVTINKQRMWARLGWKHWVPVIVTAMCDVTRCGRYCPAVKNCYQIVGSSLVKMHMQLWWYRKVLFRVTVILLCLYRLQIWCWNPHEALLSDHSSHNCFHVCDQVTISNRVFGHNDYIWCSRRSGRRFWPFIYLSLCRALRHFDNYIFDFHLNSSVLTIHTNTDTHTYTDWHSHT